MSRRFYRVFCCVAFLFGSGLGAVYAAEPAADELSSVEWRDCAGHFFFLSRVVGGEENKQMAEQLHAWGVMSVYAGETKAKAEAKAGQTSGGRGASAEDPASGQLKVDFDAMLKDHQGKAEAQGQETYVKSYADKCSGPVMAYSKRFAESVGQKPAQ